MSDSRVIMKSKNNISCKFYCVNLAMDRINKNQNEIGESVFTSKGTLVIILKFI